MTGTRSLGSMGRVEPLLSFIGNYWWIAFPLMGVFGAVGGSWRQASKRRHKRRLEIIEAKGKAKAAQLAARANPSAAYPTLATGSPEDAPAESGTTAERLQRVFDSHDAITRRWLDYELDVAKLIAFPAMSDGRQPLTAKFLRAKKVADGLRPPSTKARITPAEFAEYRDAVTDYEVAFDVAERDARRLKDSSFTEVERKRLAKAQQLLGVAVDQAATPAERQLAYRRVREELDGLLLLSDGAVDVLKEKVGLQLTTGRPQPDAAPASAPAHPASSTPVPSASASDAPPASAPSASAEPAPPHPAP